MKSVITLTALTLLLTQMSFSQWFWQNPLPQGNALLKVKFVSSNVGWAVGATGTILKTTDEGINWLIQTSGTTLPFI